MSNPPHAGGAQPSVAAPLKPIVSSKLVAPRGLARAVSRERLREQLLDARRMRCIVIQGAAGYGKTTALIEWSQALLPLRFEVAWFSITAEDNELTRFLDYLLASFAQVDPDIAREAILLGGCGTDYEAIERTVIALVRGIALYDRELVIVLDDLHHLSDPAIHDVLQGLLDYGPPNLHLVFASRASLPLSLARLRAQGLVLELDLRDLRFSLAESDRFLKDQLGDIAAGTVRRLHELTDGWAAGLQLFAVDWKKRRQRAADPIPVDELLRVHLRDDRAFAGYFEHEVLSRLSADELDLLVRVAASERFCASLCAALQTHDEALGDVETLLARLEGDNLFIVPVDQADSESWYRLHPLLREVLLQRFDTFPPDVRRDVHARAWRWFRDRGYLDEAVHHAVFAGEGDAAAELVEQSALRLFVTGDLRKLVGLVRRLAAAQVHSRIGLRLWIARVQMYAREPDACLASIASLETDIPSGDASNRFMLALVRAVLALQCDDTDAAMAVLPQLLEPPADADAVMIGGRNNVLSLLYMYRGEYERARQIQLDAPKLLIDGSPLIGTSAGRLQGRCLVGLSYALEGQITHAERVYRAVLHEAEHRGRACKEPAYMAAALLGEVLYERNDTEAARELLESRVDVLERVSIPDSVLRVLLVLSGAHWLAGHRLEALSYLERLEEYATQPGLTRLLAHSLGEQVIRRLQLGEWERARADLERLEALDAQHPNAERSALGEIGLVARLARIRFWIAQGRLGDAAVALDPLIALCEARGRQRNVANLLLLRGVVQQRLARGRAARASVLDALRLAQRLGLVRTLFDADPAAWDLILAVAKDEPLDIVLSFYVEQLRASHERRHTAGNDAPRPGDRGDAVLAGASGLLSERELEILNLLGQTLPNKKIARALGLSPETIKWHLSNIYGKLGVSGRDDAVAWMRDRQGAGPAAGAKGR